jgi:ribosome biogenesis SPOUT family RNA methylase Rps3
MILPGMPLPEAERLQELEQAMRAGQRFTVVVAEREDGSGYTLVHGAGILEAARKAELDRIRAIILPPGSLVDVQTERIATLVAGLHSAMPSGSGR